MSQEMKNKLENLSKLYDAWNTIEQLEKGEETEYAQDMIDQVIISITQEVVELYRKSK